MSRVGAHHFLWRTGGAGDCFQQPKLTNGQNERVHFFFLSSNIYKPAECFLYDLNASELTAEIHFPATLQGQCTITPKYNYQHCVEI